MSEQPTQQVCPRAPNGETHHLVPKQFGAVQRMVCAYCGKSERTLRALGRLGAGEEEDQQSPQQPGQPDQGQPGDPNQDQGQQDGEVPDPLQPIHVDPPGPSQPVTPE